MKVISLFSGCGISDVGFHQAGCESLAHVEIDKPATLVRKRHFPSAEHYDDIHDFNAFRFRGSCDVVAGGFPCQDYSVAGRRGGLSGDRGALWWQMLRVVDEAQPRYVWGENVPGLLSSSRGLSLYTIVNSLVELGYSVAWRVLDLRHFGVPQRRRRIQLVGTRMAGPCGGSSGVRIFEPDCLQRNPKTSQEAGQDSSWVAGTLSANGGGKGGGSTGNNERDFLIPELAFPLRAQPGGTLDPTKDVMIPELSRTLLAKGNDPYDPSLMTYIPEVQAFNWNQAAAEFSVSSISPTFKGRDLPAVLDLKQVTSLANRSRPSQDTASTLAAGSELAVLQNARVRRLLPVECERLMGLRDEYTRWGCDGSEISATQRYKMLGNGWSVPQARWLAERFAGA